MNHRTLKITIFNPLPFPNCIRICEFENLIESQILNYAINVERNWWSKRYELSERPLNFFSWVHMGLLLSIRINLFIITNDFLTKFVVNWAKKELKISYSNKKENLKLKSSQEFTHNLNTFPPSYILNNISIKIQPEKYSNDILMSFLVPNSNISRTYS